MHGMCVVKAIEQGLIDDWTNADFDAEGKALIGFVTNEGRFVDREEAALIQQRQPVKLPGCIGWRPYKSDDNRPPYYRMHGPPTDRTVYDYAYGGKLPPKGWSDTYRPKIAEHCGHCDTPTEVTLKPQNINLRRISPQEKKMGTKVEKEHVVKAKDAIAVAAAHWKEDPKYYAHGKKKGVFPELSKPKSYLAGVDSLGL